MYLSRSAKNGVFTFNSLVMIHVVEEKRLNDFKEVRCIKPRDLFARYGKRESIMNFDSSEEPVPIGMNKIESIEYLEQYDRMMQSQSQRDSAGADASPKGDDKSADS